MKKQIFVLLCCLGMVFCQIKCGSEATEEKTEANAEAETSEKVISKTSTTMQNAQRIELPEPVLDSQTSIEEAMKNRRSERSYRDENISLAELSQILWAAYGISKPYSDGPDFLRGGLRTAPSAGALYPLEIYVVAGNVEGLDAGIYKFDSEHHELVKLLHGDKRAELKEAALGQGMVKDAAANLVYTAVFERTAKKYGERGKNRYVYMDLGHSAQNVYLQAESLGLGTCAVGAFTDEEVAEVVPISQNEAPLYIMPLGKPKK